MLTEFVYLSAAWPPGLFRVVHSNHTQAFLENNKYPIKTVNVYTVLLNVTQL